MPYGLYISAEGAEVQSRRMEVISNNLANVNTPGFKRDLALFQARYAEAIQLGEDFPESGSINDIGGGVLFDQTDIDFSNGPLERTGSKSDMAIEREGVFFMVQKGDEQLLTRAGNFRFDADGTLVTQSGYPVLDSSGGTISIDPLLGDWEVAADGAILQGTEAKSLALVRPQSLGDLVKTGENLFRPLAEVTPVDAEDRRVASGFVEQSTVRPTIEMMEMIETSRAFEANVKLIQTQDSLIGSLISRLLSV